jgi:hypothetical protein
VIARSSTIEHTGEAVDVRALGPEVGARFVIEGSSRQAGADPLGRDLQPPLRGRPDLRDSGRGPGAAVVGCGRQEPASPGHTAALAHLKEADTERPGADPLMRHNPARTSQRRPGTRPLRAGIVPVTSAVRRRHSGGEGL